MATPVQGGSSIQSEGGAVFNGPITSHQGHINIIHITNNIYITRPNLPTPSEAYRVPQRSCGTQTINVSSQSNTPEVADYGFTTLADPPAATVDIIFIHSVSGHPRHTWTYKARRNSSGFFTSFGSQSATDGASSEVFWPADLLPQDFRYARVLTYGYDTSDNAIREPLSTFASRFQRDLVKYTAESNTVDRPKIIIAHGVGGLILEAALQSSGSASERQHNIAKSTIGMIFMATPHHGSLFGHSTILISPLITVVRQTWRFSANILYELVPLSFDMGLGNCKFLGIHQSNAYMFPIRLIFQGIDQSKAALSYKLSTAEGMDIRPQERMVPDSSFRLDDACAGSFPTEYSHEHLPKIGSKESAVYYQLRRAITKMIAAAEKKQSSS